MKIRNKLEKNQLIDYVYICFSHLKESDKRQEIIDYYRNEKYVKFEHLGENNPDKVVYMVDSSNSYTSGFFSNMDSILFKMVYAKKNGLTPVVYNRTPTHYTEPTPYKGKSCYFEYFFEQPGGIEIDEALKSSHVLWDNKKQVRRYFDLNESRRDKVHMKALREYIRIVPDIMEKLESARREFISGKRVLGIKYRGTGYKWRHKNHPIYVTPEEIIDRAKKEFEKGYDYIYLATEDNTVIGTFKRAFGSDLIYDETIKRSEEGQLHIDLATSNPSQHSAFQEGFNVLKDVWILSHTTSFVGAQCGVSKYAELFNKAYSKKPFEYLDIIDKGVYKTGVDSIKEGKKLYGKH